jgi:hypothetical protein
MEAAELSTVPVYLLLCFFLLTTCLPLSSLEDVICSNHSVKIGMGVLGLKNRCPEVIGFSHLFIGFHSVNLISTLTPLSVPGT